MRILLALGENVCILQSQIRSEARLREQTNQGVEPTEIEHDLLARPIPR